MEQPDLTETIPLEGLAERLRQIGAAYSSDHSTASRHLYFSGSLNAWIAVQRRGSVASLKYYGQCPSGC